MLRVTVELVPSGGGPALVVDVVELTNMTEDPEAEVADYRVERCTSARAHTFVVRRHLRAQGHWPLISRAALDLVDLERCVGAGVAAPFADEKETK
jgi:hypothetical protein